MSLSEELWEVMLRDGRLEDAIVEYIRLYDHVTFVEIRQRFKGVVDLSGNHCIELLPNLILWAGISQEFADAFIALRKSNRIDIAASTPLVYLMDGGMLNFPIAKRPSKRGYKSEHWVPVVLRLGPSEQIPAVQRGGKAGGRL